MTTSDQLAWCAGLIDGEGSLGIQNGRPVLRVHMADEETIRTLQARLGGTVYRYRRPPPRKENFNWYCRMGDLERVLRLLRPHIVTKAREFDAALQLLGSIDDVARARLRSEIQAAKIHRYPGSRAAAAH